MARRGWVLLIAGPDGTGKSTVAELLEQQLVARGASVQRQHYRPNVLFARHASTGTDVPQDADPAGTMRQAAKLLATALDVWVGIRRARRSVDVVLVERGWWDQLIDPRRYRLTRTTRAMVRALGFALPGADGALLLSGDVEQIHARKPELSLEELVRQLQLWHEVVGRVSPEAVRVSTTCAAVDTERVVAGVARGLVEPGWRLAPLPFLPARLSVAATPGRRDALFFYRPLTRRARLALRLAVPLSRLRKRRLALRAAVGTELAGLPTPRAVGLFRGSSPRRLVVGLSSERPAYVLKLNDVLDAGLANEQNAQGHLAANGLGDLVPTVVASGSSAGMRCLATAALPDLEAVDLRSWSDIADLCVRLQSSTPPRVHGDLAPWNLMRGPAGLLVFDWESSVERSAPLFDAVFYVVATGALLGAWSPGKAIEILMRELIPPIARGLSLEAGAVAESVQLSLRELAGERGPRGQFAQECEMVFGARPR